METIDLLAGLGWDPEIRGFLSVLTGVVVLCGSVWLLLSTNSGTRLGSLLSLAGFFGWMAIMGAIWWIYGIGYVGDRPVWEEVEIVEGESDGIHLLAAELDEAEDLQSQDLPSAQDVLFEVGADLQDDFGQFITGSGSELRVDLAGLNGSGDAAAIEFATAWIEFGVLSEDDLTDDQTEGLDADAIAELLAEENANNADTTLSELAAVSPRLIDQDDDALSGWKLLSTAEAGEAQASATEFVLESNDFSFGGQGEFIFLDTFTIGGKNGLPDDPNRWDRIWTQVRTAFTFGHPTRYGVVQLQAATEDSITNLPGQAPKRPVVDDNEPIVSVVMIRNLGNLRLLPAMVTIGSLLIFLALCYMLHERDKIVMARTAEFEAGKS